MHRNKYTMLKTCALVENWSLYMCLCLSSIHEITCVLNNKQLLPSMDVNIQNC